MAYVWNTDTGKTSTLSLIVLTVFCIVASAPNGLVFSGDQVAVYSELCYPTSLHGVSFHPHENMVAFCAFGQSQPVHVYLYDRKGWWEKCDHQCKIFMRYLKPLMSRIYL